MRTTLVTMLLLAMLGRSLPAQRGTIAGTVRDAATRAVLAGARVEGAAASAVSDDSGRFVLTVPAGSVLLSARRIGFATRAGEVRVAGNDTLIVEILLEASARLLDTVAVTANAAAGSARLGGFERRRESGRGTFITRAELDARRPLRVTDILRRVPSVTIMDSLGVRIAVSARGRKLVMSRRGADPQAPCVLRVGVDGQVKEPGFSMDLVDPLDIHGIEIYAGPSSLPAEFGGARVDMYCGLVMIWTRDR